MTTILRRWCVLLLILCSNGVAADLSIASDLRSAVPADAHMVVHGRHNPERDYQRIYTAQICQTIEDEKLLERVVDLVTSRIPESQLDTAKSVFDELCAAVEPIDWQAVRDAQEAVYAQVMEMPVTHHLLLVRLTPADAEACETAVKNLFAVIDRRAGEHAEVRSQNEGDTVITTLQLGPKEVPYQPTVARIDDVLLICTSEAIARHSRSMLLGSGEPSKFDDPRLDEALAQLPEPEDALVFFDAQQLFAQMRKMGDFIRRESHDDPKAARAADLFEKVIDEFAAIDYEITSEYTDGYRNCSTSVGRLTPNAHQTLLGQMVGGGEPFTDWQRRIPAGATAYSLTTGVNLHPVYEHVLEFLRTNIPEANPALDQFDQMQQQIGVHLDRDILQSFSGECVSISFPAADSSPGGTGSSEWVLALRCHQPDRIRELLHRGVDALDEFPAVKAQQLKLVQRQDEQVLEGFEDISATTLAMFGARPVVGFPDGWMMIASSPEAARKVLETWSGRGPTIAENESFQRFGLTIDGPVSTLCYTDLAAQTRQMAQLVRQAGAVAPMIVGVVGAKAGPEAVEPLQEFFGLLPSVAKVIDQCGYLEAKLTVVQAGSTPETYVKRSVTLVQPPAGSGPDDQAPSKPQNQ